MNKFGLLLTGFALACTLTYAGTTQAKSRRLHWSMCQPDPGASGSFLLDEDGGRLGVRTSLVQKVFCPLPEDSSFTRREVDYVNAYGIDFNVKACVYGFDRGEMHCGPTSRVGSIERGMAQPDLEVWHNRSTGSAVLQVQMGGEGQFHGYYIGQN